jgi:hypothetical protein
MSFQSESDKCQMNFLLNKLQNLFTTYVSLEINKSQEETNQLSKSKLFMVLLTPAFLKSPKCMLQLKTAISCSPKVFLLETENNKIPLDIVEDYKLNSLNCIKIRFKYDESDQNEIVNIINYHLK